MVTGLEKDVEEIKMEVSKVEQQAEEAMIGLSKLRM